jgi:hypothetical protein
MVGPIRCRTKIKEKEKATEKKNNKKIMKKEEKKTRRVPRRAISAGNIVQEHNPLCYNWARRSEESKLPSLIYDPSCAFGTFG